MKIDDYIRLVETTREIWEQTDLPLEDILEIALLRATSAQAQAILAVPLYVCSCQHPERN